jgi:hypothetical protein
MAGIVLYTQSPVAKYLWRNFRDSTQDIFFFGFLHVALMITGVVVITVGSAMAKRKQRNREKFQTVFIWFIIGLAIILIAVPWPFSPLASRPYLR